MSTLIIKYPGVKRLKQWGLLDQLVQTGCPPIWQWKDDKGDFQLEGTLPPVGGPVMIAPRRFILDKLLLDAAVSAGVELREDFVVTEIQFDGERVAGIAGRTKGGASVIETSKILIGADGKHSKVATAVQAQTYNQRPVQSCIYYSFWSGIPDRGIITVWRHHRFILAIPTHDGLTCLVVVWPSHEFQDFRKDIEANFGTP
jgi:2-polyprenyl-6-methoxyphenol hydroxylase-like FAD-dependent oxidoreductase